jgi:hypothetical protein
MTLPPVRGEAARSEVTRSEASRSEASPRGASRVGAARCLGALLAASLALACADPGVEQLKAAKAHYQALLEKSTPLQAPEFEALSAELAAVPEGSKARAEARALLASLEGARKTPVRAPLAVLGAAALEPEVSAQLAACAALARQLGATEDDAGRDRLMRALDACRARAERLDAHHLEQSELDAGPARATVPSQPQ